MIDNRITHFISSTLFISLASCESPPMPDTSEVTAVDFRSLHEEDLELHWTFEDRSGNTIYDLSGNGRHGTLSGGSFVSGPFGGDAVSLDGVDDKISLASLRDPDDPFDGETTGTFTIAARVRVADVERNNTLCLGCAPLSNFVIGSSTAGPRVVATLFDDTAVNDKTFPSSDQSLVDNTWTHVTMVVEASVGTTFYINCEEDMERTNANIELHEYDNTVVGEAGSPSNWYDGEIDDLKVWSRALSAEEIKDLCPCGGAPESYTLGIEPPSPPVTEDSSYAPPAPSGTVAWVNPADLSSDPDGLQAKVTAGYDQIVLEDGVYTADHVNGNWLNIDGQKLWAETPGGVTLEFAVYGGGEEAGSEFHGLIFDIDDEDNAYFYGADEGVFVVNEAGRAAISAWSLATDIVVEDCVFTGDALDTAIYLTSSASVNFEARRLEIYGLSRYGVYVGGGGGTVATNPIIVEDIRVWDMEHPTEIHGVAMKLGEKANVSRVHVRDARRNGIVLYGDSTDSEVTYVDVDRVGTTEAPGGIGVYFDDETESTTLDHFCIGPEVRIGVNSEWDSCPGAAKPTCSGYHASGIDNTVEYGLIEALWMGVHFDQGTVNGDVNHVTFRNYSRAAIDFYNNAITWPTYTDSGSTQSDNTFGETEVNCSVCDLTYSLWSQDPQCAGESAC
jgi:hypothetical protein